MSRAAHAYVRDVEAKAQRPGKARMLSISRARVAEQSDKVRQREADAAAYDAMCEARPLKPPPMPAQPETMTAARRALMRDRELAIVNDRHVSGACVRSYALATVRGTRDR